MDHIEAASALGQAITASKEFKEFKAAEFGALNDVAAAAILLDYRRIQEKMAEAAKGEADKEELEKLRDELLSKQSELNSHPVIKRYLDAKREYDRMMREIDGVISHFVDGGSEECSGSCETCGGCG